MAVTAAAKDKGISAARYRLDSVLPVRADLIMQLDKASGRQLNGKARLVPYKYHCGRRLYTKHSDNAATGGVINMGRNTLAF